jgi:CRP-like cAMP-binding protein
MTLWAAALFHRRGRSRQVTPQLSDSRSGKTLGTRFNLPIELMSACKRWLPTGISALPHPLASSTRARTAGSVLPHLRQSTTRAIHYPCQYPRQCRVLSFERTILPSGHSIGCSNVLYVPFAARNPFLRALVCAPTQCEFGAMIDRFLRFLEPAEEQALLAAAPVKTLAPGEVVVAEGICQRAIYVVEEGAVRIERGKAETVLAVLGPGQFFGEMSFIDGGPTSARVVANAPTRLRIIDMVTLDNLADVDPTFGARLYRSIAAIVVERLRITSADLSLHAWL